uniref:Uncharacterized protein n=1 Tax=Phakopsora pachyrhizi TaxID=170000 RepID=A0A0S1MJL2_PHAPC
MRTTIACLVNALVNAEPILCDLAIAAPQGILWCA